MPAPQADARDNASPATEVGKSALRHQLVRALAVDAGVFDSEITEDFGGSWLVMLCARRVGCAGYFVIAIALTPARARRAEAVTRMSGPNHQHVVCEHCLWVSSLNGCSPGPEP